MWAIIYIVLCLAPLFSPLLGQSQGKEGRSLGGNQDSVAIVWWPDVVKSLVLAVGCYWSDIADWRTWTDTDASDPCWRATILKLIGAKRGSSFQLALESLFSRFFFGGKLKL